MIRRSFVKISISEHRYYGEYSCNPLENRLQFAQSYIDFISFLIVCTALDIKGQFATNDILNFREIHRFFYIQFACFFAVSQVPKPQILPMRQRMQEWNPRVLYCKICINIRWAYHA
jgi:hypothetical protein